MRMWLIVVLALLALVKAHGTHVVPPQEASQKPREMNHGDECVLIYPCWREIVTPVAIHKGISLDGRSHCHSAKRRTATRAAAIGTAQTDARAGCFEPLAKKSSAVWTGKDKERHWREPGQKQSSQAELRHPGRQNCTPYPIPAP